MSKFSSQIAMFDNQCEMSSLLLFDPKETIVYVADEKDHISTWDYTAGFQTNSFPNQTPKGPRVTSMSVVNEGLSGMLLVGSDDGVARLWQHCHTRQAERLVTAWTVVPDLISVGFHGPGLLLEWQ